MEAILDTNFIISCLLKKIDFLEEIKSLGFTPIIPREVLEELKDLKKESKTSHKERVIIELALEMLEKKEIKKIKLCGKYVDDGLIKKGKQGIYIATLDNGIKSKIPNKIIISNSKKSLAVQRG